MNCQNLRGLWRVARKKKKKVVNVPPRQALNVVDLGTWIWNIRVRINWCQYLLTMYVSSLLPVPMSVTQYPRIFLCVLPHIGMARGLDIVFWTLGYRIVGIYHDVWCDAQVFLAVIAVKLSWWTWWFVFQSFDSLKIVFMIITSRLSRFVIWQWLSLWFSSCSNFLQLFTTWNMMVIFFFSSRQAHKRLCFLIVQ